MESSRAPKYGQKANDGSCTGNAGEIERQQTDVNNNEVVTIPINARKETVQSLKLLTAHQETLLQEHSKLTRALNEANKRMQRLEIEAGTSVNEKDVEMVNTASTESERGGFQETQTPSRIVDAPRPTGRDGV